MICVSCGKEISEGSVFCNYCGAKQKKEEPKAEKMYCSQCQKEFDADMMFCDECGMKLTPAGSGNTQSGNGFLLQIELASICRGSKPIGATAFHGTVYFYDDRIETKVMLADNAEVFARMEDITGVSKGSYLGIWSCLTINLKNGEAYTIAGAATSSATIDRAIDIIKRNIA